MQKYIYELKDTIKNELREELRDELRNDLLMVLHMELSNHKNEKTSASHNTENVLFSGVELKNIEMKPIHSGAESIAVFSVDKSDWFWSGK